jgi:Beta-lactamase enzyme family
MTPDQLAQGLLQAVRAQDFGSTADAMRGGKPLVNFPSIDLAVAAFPKGGAPVWANVLFSREFPQGIVATIDAHGGPVSNVKFLADQRNARGDSFLWWPDADWSQQEFTTLFGQGPQRFVAPYPASLLKMMVAVGVAMAVDAGRTRWPEKAMDAMITVSDNDATTEMVALLHRLGFIGKLQDHLSACGLPTLRLQGTQPDGGWGNGSGAGVGMIQMTAWDSARLMWLLDADAPSPPWLHARMSLVSNASRARLRGWLEAQKLGEILSSTALVGLPGWVPGIPSELRFAHKTGTTENYASDAGIVRGRPPLKRHYIVAVLTSLGERYSPHEKCATTWRLPALGAAVDALLAPWLERAG